MDDARLTQILATSYDVNDHDHDHDSDERMWHVWWLEQSVRGRGKGDDEQWR